MNYLNETVEQKYTLQSVRQDYQSKKHLKFFLFWGHQPEKDGSIGKGCLSQWWKSDFEADGKKYHCMEQFMMYSKAKLFGDNEILNQIMKSNDPKMIKALGRKVRNFDEKVWNEHKYSIVYYGNLMKFSQNEELRKFLLSTKDKILAEASPYDAVWGIKLSAKDENSKNPFKWRGENLLGFALMQVREALSE